LIDYYTNGIPMDVIVQIFSSLGVDQSFYYQLVLVIFFLASFYAVFVSDLRRVLMDRKVNTVGAEDKSQEITTQAIRNEEKFQKSVQEKLSEVNEKYNKERAVITKFNEQEYHEAEAKNLAEYDTKLSQVESEYKNSKTKLATDVEELSQLLMTKIKSGKN
jgi:F0F1-type ATP synthase membrane subunit b/b'